MAPSKGMDPARWQEIERLFHAAHERPVPERAAFLAQACAGDPVLRHEVELLLTQAASEDGFLEAGAMAAAGRTRGPSVLTGRRLGVYEVQEQIGAGGMGEVYRAHDTRLRRDVAIKILPAAVTTDPDRLRRFEREARMLASLNHPNIATIHGVEESDGVHALVLELVEGETLAERIARAVQKGRSPALSLDEAQAIARQIADALDAAHDKGIIHRDLKPANIKVSTDGVVKVLDFGLAKVAASDGSTPDLTQSPTVTVGGTRDGVILGTAAYMSPEQARAQPVDKRADIWAFGCVLYEMLTGRIAFAGTTVSDTIAAILEREPDWSRLPQSTPHGIRRLLQRCLQKDAKRRLRDIADARIELDESALAPLATTESAKPLRWAWALGLLSGVAILAAVVAIYLRPQAPERPVQFSLVLERTAYADIPRVAPDGSAILYSAADPSGRRQLWLRRLDVDRATVIPGTDDALYPFWSPDGRWIGFYADQRLKKVSRDGGNPETIAVVPAFDGTAAWSAKGDILFAPGNRTPLYRIPDSGGTPQQVTKLDESRGENSHRAVRFLPDGTDFLFSARSSNRENNALYSGSLDSGEIRRVASIQSNVSYVPPRDGRAGMLVFARDGGLYSQPFDGTTLSGEAVRLTDVGYRAISLQGSFDVSMDGRVLIASPLSATEQRLTWFDRKGVNLGTLGSVGGFEQPRISPDGNRVIFNRPDDNGGNRDLWLIESGRGVAARLTTTPVNEWNALWASDGRRVLFTSDRNGHRDGSVWEKTSMDAGAGESPVKGLPDWANSEDLSPDGKWILFSNGASHAGVWVGSTSGDQKPFRFFDSGFEDRVPHFSPDGKWIAYHSNESGRFEVYVRPFAGVPAESGEKIRISVHGGFYATWSRGGRELFFIGPDAKLYATLMNDVGGTTAVPIPQALFTVCAGSIPTGSATQGAGFDVAPDGQRFLFVCNNESQNRYAVTVNWQAPK